MRTRTKFRCDPSNHCWDVTIFRVFKMAAAAILIFKIWNFQQSDASRRSNSVAVPNLVDISQTAAEIWWFFDFSRWRPLPSWIFIFFSNFNGWKAQEGRTASLCQIWLENVYSCPQNVFFLGEGFDALNWGLSYRDPQKALIIAETRRMSH